MFHVYPSETVAASLPKRASRIIGTLSSFDQRMTKSSAQRAIKVSSVDFR
jgi:hypothetical protein